MLHTEPYELQRTRWPQQGRHILAHFDASTIVVYQAYSEAIGRFAATHGWFGGDFSYGRWSWIKPGFLWMMFRSGWGTKPDWTVVLAVHLKREAFDQVLTTTVHSVFLPAVYGTEASWKKQIPRFRRSPAVGPGPQSSWGEDSPQGYPTRSARRDVAAIWARLDRADRRHHRPRGGAATTRGSWEARQLVTPSETVYPETLAQHLGTTDPGIVAKSHEA